MRVSFIIILLCGLLLAAHAMAQPVMPKDDVTGKPEPLLKPLDLEDPHFKAVKSEADRSLARARSAIKTNGFYCAIIELNIWANLSQRGGTYNEELHNELKNELYGSSMMHMDKWFNYYIKKGYYNDAQKCLQTWRLHAIAINQFDEELYNQKTTDLEAIKPQ